jgi:transcription-repair coupling factor (superfamily II helicase)
MISQAQDLLVNIEPLKKLHDTIVSSRKIWKKIYVSPLHGSSKSLLAASLASEIDQMVLLLPNIQKVNETKVELNILGVEKTIITIDEFNKDILQEKLTDINSNSKFILISSYELLNKKIPSRKSLEKSTTKIQAGGEITYDEMMDYFGVLNYNKEKFVDIQGNFSVRGSIIDFWSYSEKQPCRLEFDGDFLESIRYYDPESQRSAKQIEFVTIAAQLAGEEDTTFTDIFEYLTNPSVIASEYELNNIFAEKKEEEKKEITYDIDADLKKEIYDKHETEVKETIIDECETGAVREVSELLDKKALWIIEEEIASHDERINLGLTEAPAINANFERLFETLKDFASKGLLALITVENDLQADKIRELLSDFREELAEYITAKKIKIIVLPIKDGFIARKSGIAVFTDYQIFNKPYRTKLSSKQRYKKSRVKDFASIKKGDYVVHENYGIGQYAGLEIIRIGEIEQESIKILYAEGGVVYVNLNYLSLVKKFSSKENAKPRLSVLGSGEWKSTKKKVKSKIKEAARELITLYAKRKSTPGITYSPDSIWQKELEASFFYEDTPDQSKVSEEVKRDMESDNPMDRLVCGDVGFGKTEIAVRAAFKAVNDSKQVAILVPTTILAEQHFNTFKDRLAQFPVRIEVISRFQSKVKQKEIVEKLKEGKVDIVVGTHRLLSKDIQFKDIGLLIIDEEHRFGVMAKEKLRAIRANVDTLTLTATPIPRTLNLSLLGARDLSLISTPPPNRQPIYTKVDTFDIMKIRQWILAEIKREGQIYFVHDRVQSIDKLTAYIKKYIPEINIGVAHGQMKPAMLENVIYDFLNKKYHMLISTKIIESGLDIPNVNTIIINRADRFGLAELHQLRGRVGRSDRQAHAFFIVPSLKTITKKAVKRLQAVEEYTDLGEGFNIAMRDLEIRGAGNLLGTEQSGFIDSVGFELYVKLLDEAVEELKTEEFKEIFKELPRHQERTEPTIDTYFEIGIPKEFMPDQADRLSFYTALFSMLKVDEVDEIKEELVDRFGKLPLLVERLILAAITRYYASFAMFDRIVVQKTHISMILPKGEREEYYKNKFALLMQYIIDKYPNDLQFRQTSETMKLEMKNKFTSPESAMEFLIRFCKELIKLFETAEAPAA